MSPYLHKRKKCETYYYRRRTPVDMLRIIGKPLIRLTLKTTNGRIATKMANRIDERLEKAFADIRTTSMSLQDAKQLVEMAFSLNNDEISTTSLKISNIASEYKKVRGQSWPPKSVQEHGLSLQLVIDCLGDIIIQLIDKNKCIKVRDYMTSKGQGPRTVNKHLGRLNSWLKHQVKCGELQINPCEGVLYHITEKEKKQKSYIEYSIEDIKFICYNMLNFKDKNKKPSRFWLPVIAMFTGARKNEIAELTKDDICTYESITKDKIYYIKIVDTKTIAGFRNVPIHSKLIKLGFIDFIDGLKEGQSVFFDLPEHRDGRGHDYKWYMREFRKYCDDDRKVFHSWRHTVASVLNNVGVPSTHRADILGHERASDCETDKTYTSITQLRTLQAAVEKINYDFIEWEKITS
jgi:integrase